MSGSGGAPSPLCHLACMSHNIDTIQGSKLCIHQAASLFSEPKAQFPVLLQWVGPCHQLGPQNVSRSLCTTSRPAFKTNQSLSPPPLLARWGSREEPLGTAEPLGSRSSEWPCRAQPPVPSAHHLAVMEMRNKLLLRLNPLEFRDCRLQTPLTPMCE